MAITFCLSVRTDPDNGIEACNEMRRHFDGQIDALPCGFNVQWIASDDGQFYSTIWSRELGGNGIDSISRLTQTMEAAYCLVKRLLTAPDFIFARAGIEADRMRHEDYIENSREGCFYTPDGMVLSESFWQELGSPPRLHPFREGYVWNPYNGEVIHSPLFFPEFASIREKFKTFPG